MFHLLKQGVVGAFIIAFLQNVSPSMSSMWAQLHRSECLPLSALDTTVPCAFPILSSPGESYQKQREDRSVLPEFAAKRSGIDRMQLDALTDSLIDGSLC